MKKSQLRQLIREVLDEMNQLDEYESSEIIPGIKVNDEGSYDINYGTGLELYNQYVKGKTTIGDLVTALKIQAKVNGNELSDSEAIRIAYAIEDKYSKSYSGGSKYGGSKYRRF